MAGEIMIKGVKAPNGAKMTKGAGWRLATTKGTRRVFSATLLQTFNIGKKRIAIFNVPK